MTGIAHESSNDTKFHIGSGLPSAILMKCKRTHNKISSSVDRFQAKYIPM